MTRTLDTWRFAVTLWKKRLAALAALAALVVAVSSAALAIRTGRWEPVLSVGWLPVVVVAVWPASSRRCLRRRRTRAS